MFPVPDVRRKIQYFFASVFTDKTRPQGSLSQETRVKKQKEDFPLVREDWV